MHIHLPKPLHGWREFIGEVGVIVVGVLIALAAEQLVQSFEWHHRIHASEAAMLQELSSDGRQAYARYAVHECFQSRLNSIRTAVEQGRSREEVAALTSAYRPPFWTWDSLALGAATSSNALIQMDPEVAQRWTSAYNLIPALDRANEREFHDTADLAGVAQGGGPLSPDDRRTLLRTVEHLRQDEFQIFYLIRFLLPGLYAVGVRFKRESLPAYFAELPNSEGCLITPPGPVNARRD